MIEMQEDEFIELKKGYERSLNDFNNEISQILARKNEILTQMVKDGSNQAMNQLDESDYMRRKIDGYVDMQIDTIENLSCMMRNAFEDKREDLMKERII